MEIQNIPIYEEYGFAWNLLRLISPNLLFEEFEDLYFMFAEEFKNQKKIIVTSVSKINMFIFQKMFELHLKEKFTEIVTTKKLTVTKRKRIYNPEYVKYKIANGKELILTCAPDDLPKEFINWDK